MICVRLIMKSIVLNLPEDKDRLESFLANYPSDVFGDVEVWKAKSGEEANVPAWWKRKPNRYALAENQMDILDSVNEDVIIWEDDCIFVDGFKDKYKQFMKEVPKDADIIFLGCQHAFYPERISENVLKLNIGLTSHAILYKKKCLKRFSDFLKEPNWGCKHFPDQKRSQGIYLKKFVAYAPFHNLCGQAACYSNLCDHDRPERWYDTFTFVDLDGVAKKMKKGVIQE